MRHNWTPSQVRQPQLTSIGDDSSLFKDTYSDPSDRFVHVKKLIDMFSQKLMSFLHKTHESSVTDWMTKDEKEHWLVGQLQKTEGAYPPHVIALRDLINFLSAVSENLDLLNQLLTHSRNGIADIAILAYWQFLTTPGWLSETHAKYKKIQGLLASWEKLQKSIGAIKQLPIQNGVIDASLYLHAQLSKYLQGDKGDHLTKVIQVMKDVLSSSELLLLKQNDNATNEQLENKLLSVKAKLELDYWKILLATSESQRKSALDHARSLNLSTGDENAILAKIAEFAKSPAWDVQRLTFLEHAQQLPVPQQGSAKDHLTPEKLWLYSMQLKSIIGQIIAVSPEFMAEDNDAGNMLRMIGTLKRLPTSMITKIDHEWFMHVMAWLRINYHELCKDEQLKDLVESVYNIHTNFLADLDELETQLGLKFGLLTHDIPQKLRELKPAWVALSGEPGPTETRLREQAQVWERYLQKQAFFRAQQRIARLTYQTHLLEKKKEVMEDLLEGTRLQKISHIHTLHAREIKELRDELVAIAQEFPELSLLGKYIEKKLQEIDAQIARVERFQDYRLGRMLLMNSRLWTQNQSSNEARVIRAAIEATVKELKVSLVREDEYLQIAWDTYQARIHKLDPKEITAKLERHRELCEQIKALQEKLNARSLEDVRAQQASEEDRELLEKLLEEDKKILLELEEFFEFSQAEQVKEKTSAAERLSKNIQENSKFVSEADRMLIRSQVVLSRLSQMRGYEITQTPVADPAKTSQLINPSEQNAKKEQASIEQLLKKIDSVIAPLARHISDGQLYQENAFSINKSLFRIRKCDAQWIRQLKQTHNLLVQAKAALSAYQDNLAVQVKSQESSLMAYRSVATPYLQLTDSLLKLFSKVGDILEEINTFEPHVQQNWIKPLKELLSTARQLSLASTDEREPASREPAQLSSMQVSAGAPPTPISVRQRIKQDVQELLVELPSNLPGRVQLDNDFTALFSMIDGLLGVNAAILTKNGYALYDSIEFKRLMDLISKISAIVGSDFVHEKLSSYRALLTEQLSAAIQRILAEEIKMGYRSGVITEGLYQKAEVLAGYGLVDIPTLYAAQLSYLRGQNLDVDIKDHFAAYIESLLKAYVNKQKEEWNRTRNQLTKEVHSIRTEVIDIIRRRGNHYLPSTQGKDLVTQQQSLELRVAQINRLIVAKNREMAFLEKYATTQHEERKALSDKYAKQEKELATLSRIVRQLTMVKWDIYYYEFATFTKNVEKINELIKSLEEYIEKLATNDIQVTPDSIAKKIEDENKPPLPAAMQHLFALALQAISEDRRRLLTTDPTGVFEAVNSPVIDPTPGLCQALKKYAYEEAKRLDVKNDWYKRHIIEHLEIFTEMWSPEKAQDQQIAQRRSEILAALQAENAPDYKLLSHPADVKIVYLLTVSGQYGLGFHDTIFSKSGMIGANKRFSRTDVTQPAGSAQPKVETLSRKTDNEAVSIKDMTSAIESYQHSHQLYGFFNSLQGGHIFLTEQNKLYLLGITEKYTGDQKGKEKLRAIYNALVNKDPEALLEAVFLETGWVKSNAGSVGKFERPVTKTLAIR